MTCVGVGTKFVHASYVSLYTYPITYIKSVGHLLSTILVAGMLRARYEQVFDHCCLSIPIPVALRAAVRTVPMVSRPVESIIGN